MSDMMLSLATFALPEHDCFLLRVDPSPETETSTLGGTCHACWTTAQRPHRFQTIPASPGPGLTGSAAKAHSPQHPEATFITRRKLPLRDGAEGPVSGEGAFGAEGAIEGLGVQSKQSFPWKETS